MKLRDILNIAMMSVTILAGVFGFAIAIDKRYNNDIVLEAIRKDRQEIISEISTNRNALLLSLHREYDSITYQIKAYTDKGLNPPRYMVEKQLMLQRDITRLTNEYDKVISN